MSENIGLPVLLTGLESTEQSIRTLGQDEPHKAFLLGHAIAKMADSIKKDFKEPFKDYFDTNKELPGGFSCKVAIRTGYKFEEDEEWSRIKKLLDDREELLKSATIANEKGNNVFDGNGEEIKGVTKTFSEVYNVSKK